MNGLFTYPSPVNEKAARIVAICVVAVSVLGLVTGWYWLLAVLAVGFWLRVLTGPRIDPFALLAKNLAPKFGKPAFTPGPPKRFAQTIGAVLTTFGAVMWFGFDSQTIAVAVLAIMAVFASLEGFLNICVGCKIFAVLMKIGVIPDRICLECADISRRHAG